MSSISRYPDDVITELLQLPAGPSPDGEPFSFEASDDNGRGGLAFLIFALVVATISLVIRSYTKIKLIKQWNAEDTLLSFSLAIFAFYFAEAILAGQHGSSQHMWNITLGEYYLGLEHVNLCAVAFCVFQALVKVAILLQFHRIFVPSHSSIRKSLLHYIIYATIATTIIFYTILTFCTIWICNPREALWNPYVRGSCMDWIALSKAVALFTVTSDFALLFIPIFPVLQLQMAKGKKIAIIAVFAVGFIDCMAAILRMYYTWRLVEETDYSWNTSIQGMFTALEMSFGILVATLPIVPRFYKHLKQSGLIPGFLKLTSRQRTQENQIESKLASNPPAKSENVSRHIVSAARLPNSKNLPRAPNNTRYSKTDSDLHTETSGPK